MPAALRPPSALHVKTVAADKATAAADRTKSRRCRFRVFRAGIERAQISGQGIVGELGFHVVLSASRADA